MTKSQLWHRSEALFHSAQMLLLYKLVKMPVIIKSHTYKYIKFTLLWGACISIPFFDINASISRMRSSKCSSMGDISPVSSLQCNRAYIISWWYGRKLGDEATTAHSAAPRQDLPGTKLSTITSSLRSSSEDWHKVARFQFLTMSDIAQV